MAGRGVRRSGAAPRAIDRQRPCYAEVLHAAAVELRLVLEPPRAAGVPWVAEDPIRKPVAPVMLVKRDVAVISDYGWDVAEHPIYINRALRRAGLLNVELARNGERLEPGFGEVSCIAGSGDLAGSLACKLS